MVQGGRLRRVGRLRGLRFRRAEGEVEQGDVSVCRPAKLP